jgi:hypothetical protein
VGQNPNIELSIEDLPRPVLHPSPARRWSPDRPGELGSPEDVPWGGRYGTPGPDTGFVLMLLADREIAVAPGERRADVVAALAAFASARASHFGRAPVLDDIRVAEVLLGLDPDGIPETTVAKLAADRPAWMIGLAHHPHKAGALVASVPRDVLAAAPDAVRARMASEGPLVHG